MQELYDAATSDIDEPGPDCVPSTLYEFRLSVAMYNNAKKNYVRMYFKANPGKTTDDLKPHYSEEGAPEFIGPEG